MHSWIYHSLCEPPYLWHLAAVQVDRLALLAAAVPSNCFDEDQAFPRARVAAKAISVFHSSNDDVLSSGFWLGEALSGEVGAAVCGGLVPLGLNGIPSQPVSNLDRVDVLDVSAEVGGHNPNTWLTSTSLNELLGVELGAPCFDSALGEDEEFDAGEDEELGEQEFQDSCWPGELDASALGEDGGVQGEGGALGESSGPGD
eukprot:TRINITY_DN18200_c0_g1_i3.p3 TRINITY_DN18200_c0_g1~~TRINITY_DN18200_c0_g1_i3.p3  ORF type:complete len:201 (-),score=39.64 TRINITY_DN18200_c0_g1_i3:20-622(-)